MTEEKIQEAKERIKDKLSIRKEILILKKKLIRAGQRKNRRSYYAILSKINFLESYLGGLSTSKIVNHEFNVTGSLDDNCSHDLWYYVGSYNGYINNDGKVYYESPVNNENVYNFSYNKYVCMDCGKIINVKNWEYFENRQIVLKSYEQIPLFMMLNFYHQLLYVNPNYDEVISSLIEQFNLHNEYMERKLVK